MFETDAKILACIKKEMSPTQVCKKLGITASSFSHSIARLRTQTVITVRKEGSRTYYRSIKGFPLSTGASEDPWGHIRVWGTKGIVDCRSTPE